MVNWSGDALADLLVLINSVGPHKPLVSLSQLVPAWCSVANEIVESKQCCPFFMCTFLYTFQSAVLCTFYIFGVGHFSLHIYNNGIVKSLMGLCTDQTHWTTGVRKIWILKITLSNKNWQSNYWGEGINFEKARNPYHPIFLLSMIQFSHSLWGLGKYFHSCLSQHQLTSRQYREVGRCLQITAQCPRGGGGCIYFSSQCNVFPFLKMHFWVMFLNCLKKEEGKLQNIPMPKKLSVKLKYVVYFRDVKAITFLSE